MIVHWRLLIGLGVMSVALLGSSLWAAERDQPKSADSDQREKGAETADSLATRQEQIAEKYKHLEDVLLRMAELSAATDPRRAVLLKKAVAQSKDELIAVRLDRLVDLLGKEQLSRALESQTEVEQDLHTLLELLLSENRQKHIENEKARIREYLKRIGALINQQKDIQGRVAGGDDAKRLVGEQGKVAGKTGELAHDVRKSETPASPGPGETAKRDSKDGERSQGGGKPQPGQNGEKKQEPKKGGDSDSPAPENDQSPATVRNRLEAAQQRMKEAEAKLKEAERKGAGEKQEEAIRQLQLAKAKLEEILRQLREEEIERTLAMLEARFRKMLQMQEEVYEGTTRLDKVPPADRTHNHEIEASRLSGKESDIVVEIDKALLLLHDDGTAVAMLEAAEQARDDMQQTVERLAQVKVGKTTQSIEEDILAALKEMVDALTKAQKDNANKKKAGQRSNGQPQDPPLIDGLSELRMIRALQMRVNTRTARYAKLIDGEQADNADLLDALRRLAEREERIYRVTHDLQMGKNR